MPSARTSTSSCQSKPSASSGTASEKVLVPPGVAGAGGLKGDARDAVRGSGASGCFFSPVRSASASSMLTSGNNCAKRFSNRARRFSTLVKYLGKSVSELRHCPPQMDLRAGQRRPLSSAAVVTCCRVLLAGVTSRLFLRALGERELASQDMWMR